MKPYKLLTLSLLLIVSKLPAQLDAREFPCLFLLDIHEKGQMKQATGIEVYLLNEYQKPITTSKWIKEDHTTKVVPIKIIPNHSLKTATGLEYPKAGDYFVVKIRQSRRLTRTNQYFAMVIKDKDTSFYLLPTVKLLNIAENDLCGRFPKENIPMRQLNGEFFTPIDIEIGNPMKNAVAYVQNDDSDRLPANDKLVVITAKDRKTCTVTFPKMTVAAMAKIRVHTQTYTTQGSGIPVTRFEGWHERACQLADSSLLFTITPNIDIIEITVGDQYQNTCKFDFHNPEQRMVIPFYLISPDQTFFNDKGNKVPIEYPGFRYIIRLQEWSESSNNAASGEIPSPIKKLQKKHPKLHFTPFQNQQNLHEINLTDYSGKQRNRILSKLENTRDIAYLSQVTQPAGRKETFAKNTILIVFKTGTTPEQLRYIIDNHGFQQLIPTDNNKNIYQATYKEKRCDKAFFEAINALSAEPDILYASPVFYDEVEGSLE